MLINDLPQKRNVGGVFICTDINWGGRCGYAVQPVNECIVLGSDWDKQISSFGPDQCTECTAYACVSSSRHPGGISLAHFVYQV